MALVYTGSHGLFAHLGPIISRINSYLTLGLTTMPADLLSLETAFSTDWLPTEGVAAMYEGLRSNVAGWRQSLAALGDRRLMDRDLVLTPLNLQPGSGFTTLLPALWRDMTEQSKTVKACTCAVGSVTASSGNRGNGSAWVDLTLDGYNPPLLGAQSLFYYDGLRSQLCVPSETMTLECVADSATDGLTEGAESWAWSGGPAYAPYEVRAEGSGVGPGLSTADEGAGVISGGSLNSWSGSTPSGWTVSDGSGSLSRDTTTYHRGTASAKVTGGASVVRFYQSITSGIMQGRRRYFVGFSLKASAAAAGATARVYLAGDGYPQVGLASINGASFSTSWTSYGAWGTVPSPVPANWRLVVEVEGLPSGTNVWLGSVNLAPAQYHGGVAAQVTAGTLPWVRGDRLSWTVTNDQAGKIQGHFRRWYRSQLPSVLAGSSQGYFLGLPLTLMLATTAETVADSLAS